MKKIVFFSLFICSLNSIGQNIGLGELANKNGSTLKYVAVGSILSAGVRDGGIYEASQSTAFPSLLAQQIGINNFKIPLLSGNGTGMKKVNIDRYGILKFQETKGIDDTQKSVKLPSITIDIDNLSIPYQKLVDIYEKNEDDVNSMYDNRSFRHLQRYSKSSKVSYFDLINSKSGNIDFFTFEFGFYDYIQFIEAGGTTDITYVTGRESLGEIKLLEILLANTSRGVILNVPDYLRFPIFHLYKLSDLSRFSNGSKIYIEHWRKSHVREAKEGDIFLPRNSVIDLLQSGAIGTLASNPLQDKDVFDIDEQRLARPEAYNEALTKFGVKYKIPVVDIYSLYNKILDGEYINSEGVTIDTSFPNGNFFSNDGITPTKLGQAVITNEIIKVINSHYNSNIPLLILKKFM